MDKTNAVIVMQTIRTADVVAAVAQIMRAAGLVFLSDCPYSQRPSATSNNRKRIAPALVALFP